MDSNFTCIVCGDKTEKNFNPERDSDIQENVLCSRCSLYKRLKYTRKKLEWLKEKTRNKRLDDSYLSEAEKRKRLVEDFPDLEKYYKDPIFSVRETENKLKKKTQPSALITIPTFLIYGYFIYQIINDINSHGWAISYQHMKAYLFCASFIIMQAYGFRTSFDIDTTNYSIPTSNTLLNWVIKVISYAFLCFVYSTILFSLLLLIYTIGITTGLTFKHVLAYLLTLLICAVVYFTNHRINSRFFTNISEQSFNSTSLKYLVNLSTYILSLLCFWYILDKSGYWLDWW